MKKATKLDTSAVVLAAAIPFAVYFLPAETKDSFRLFSGNMTATSLYASNYVHFDFWGHLMGNLLVFVPVGILSAILPGRSGRRKLFYLALAFNLLVSPWLLSLLWLTMNSSTGGTPTDSYGFSGVVAASAGVLVVASLIRLRNFLKLRIFPAGIAMMALIPLTFSILYIPVVGSTFLWTSVLLAIIFLGFFYLFFSANPDFGLKNDRHPSGLKRAYALSIPFWVLFIFTALFFPLQVRSGDTTVNATVHYMGLLIGILLTGFLSLDWKSFRVSDLTLSGRPGRG